MKHVSIHLSRRMQDVLLLLPAPLGLCLVLEGYSRGTAAALPDWIWNNPAAFGLTCAMWLGLCLLMSALRSYGLRWCLTFLWGLAAALVGMMNRYKMRYRMEPALFTDFYQLRDAMTTVKQLDFSIDMGEVALAVTVFLLAAAMGLLLTHRRRRKIRLVLPAIGLAVMLLAAQGCTFERASGRTRYDLVDLANTEGALYTAVAVENNRRAQMRMDYDEQQVRSRYRALMEAVSATEPVQDPPNIILVLSESYTSEAWLSRYVDFTRELTPFMNRLTASCPSGSLYVPKAGGGTSETEFEVLTGLRSQYSINPYAMGLPPMNSLASILREKGYAASAIHWYSGVYYNRYNNLRQLGFTEFFTTDTTERSFGKKGMFVSDEEHYRSALEQLRRTEEKDFIFVLTMQNHGGYAYDDFRQTYGADVPFANQLSAESEKILANYCWLLQQSDAALETFVHELEMLEEPTLLVFFGDHIAPLGQSVYDELGVVTTGREARLTPWFIWSNRGNEPASAELQAWQLGAQVLRAAGLNDDPFLHYVETLNTDGDTLYDLLSYDALFGKQYAYAEGGLQPQSQQLHIGGEMVLAGFDAAQVGDAIYLRPQLQLPHQAWQLSVNGQRFDSNWVYADAGEFTLQCVMPGFGNTCWNESNTLTYASAQALLEAGGALPYTAYELADAGFERQQGRLLSTYDTWKSTTAYAVGSTTALTVDGKRYQWQPTYGLTREGQYAVDAEGFVYVTLQRDSLPDADGMLLYAFED